MTTGYEYMGLTVLIGFVLIIISQTFLIIRPTERGLIERFGKYNRFAKAGLNICIPLIERIERVNITEQMVDANSQEIITNDNLNATVDAQIYFKVKANEEQVKCAIYNVDDYKFQIVNLARTTLRNIIGTMSLKEANSERDTINGALVQTLSIETNNWGIDIVRAELKEIQPPKDVQETMNRVVKAENEKLAAKDYATAEETKADGVKRAAIKEAEGTRQRTILISEGNKTGMILEAEGKAKAIELENTAAQEYFKDAAVDLKKLETTAESLRTNSKIVLPQGESLVNVIGDMAGIVPIPLDKKPSET